MMYLPEEDGAVSRIRNKRNLAFFDREKAQIAIKNKPYRQFPNYIKQIIAEMVN